MLEGGSIDVNGQGTLLTTEECLLSDVQQRNPGMTREQIEQVLADYLGIRKVLWLGKASSATTPTATSTTWRASSGRARSSPWSSPTAATPTTSRSQENLRRLRAMTDQDGRALEVVELPMPRPLFFRSTRLPASYANFYIANGVVLVPTFNDPNDRVALNTLARLFPDREVVGIHSVDYVWGFGTLHCSTQQEPQTEPRA